METELGVVVSGAVVGSDPENGRKPPGVIRSPED